MTKQRMILAVVAVAVIILAVVLNAKRFVKPAVQDTTGLGTVGTVAAEETSRLLNGKGRIAVIKVESGLGQPTELIWRGFDSTLKKWAGIQIAAEEIVPGASANTSARVRDAILKHSALDAVVLLGGAGDVPFNLVKDLPQPRPRLLSVLTFSLGQTIQLVEEGVLVLGIGSRPIGAPPASPPMTAMAIFAQQYTVVTPDTVGKVKEELAAKPTADFVP